jgi:hypothetical protein
MLTRDGTESGGITPMSNLMRAFIVLSAAFLTLAGCVVEPVPVHFQPIVRVR